MYPESQHPPPEFFVTKILAVIILLLLLGGVVNGFVHRETKIMLRAIHTHDRDHEATLMLNGSSGTIKVPAIGIDPEKIIQFTTDESAFDVALNALVIPLFPVYGHTNRTITIDDTSLQFVHTGAFYVCEQCHSRGLPKTWAIIDDESA
jgi:hypothetical protein